VAKKKSTKKKTATQSAASRKKTASKAGKKAASGKTAGKSTTQSSKKTTKKSTRKKAAKTAPKKKPTKKVSTKKTARTSEAAGSTAGERAAKPPKKIKTKLTAKQLRHYQALLIEKRVELIGDIVGIEEAALRGRDTTNLSTMPLHMADAGSDTYDQDLMLGLMESERKLLVEIDEALMRIADKTFGVCLATGQMINQARLEAKPWAKYCIEAAREIERNGGRMPNNNNNNNNNPQR